MVGVSSGRLALLLPRRPLPTVMLPSDIIMSAIRRAVLPIFTSWWFACLPPLWRFIGKNMMTVCGFS